ncbi:MAG: 5-(carboxyamino)imidazole ribonucleotide mutase [Desulfobacterota bacterium]|nr:5-(carboxyamino)imidazole ribonucleotide mutase [Thermodesulfobacteriota bacterium]MDW8001714.1 5-(carboxyamino)imidazole ribonucleotide mutase [Deltaproteobacteria bacterium]
MIETAAMDKKPKVLILVGSKNDLPKLEEAFNFLREMGVEFVAEVSSAHRNPEKTVEYAKTARDKGIEVIIAAAGLAAHLPGVLAAHTTLPVIGVPLSAGAIKGLDSLLSIVQMPSGVPVATVGIDATKNAAILACQILSIKYEEIAERLKKFKEELKSN